MLQVTTYGRVTTELELKSGAKGPYMSFSLAVDKGFGEKKRTVFVDCWAFGDQAEALDKCQIKKGRSIWVSGDGDLPEFQRRDGSKDHSLKVTVSQWGFLPMPKPSQPTSESQEIPTPMEPPPLIDGDNDEMP